VDIEKIAKRLLGFIETSGVDEGEVYIQSNEGLEVNLRDQAVERLRNKASAGYALRLIQDKRMGFVHSSDLREESLERTVAKGVELARMAAPDEFNSLVEPAEDAPPLDTFDEAMDGVSYDRKIGILKDVETLCFAYDPSIAKIEDLSYEDSKIDTVIANSRGVFRQGRSTHFSVSASVVAESNGNVETGGEWSEAVFFEDLGLPREIAARACWKATALLGGEAVPTQAVPIIFDRDTGHALLRHLFAMIDGNNVADGLSMLEGKIGEQIGSPLVTILDDPTIVHGIGSCRFDDEGTPSRRSTIVDKGVLASFLFDRKSGQKTGLGSTGNAKRGGFRQMPSVGVTNYHLAKGNTTPDEIIASTDKGLLVVSLAGWWVGINPSTGDFSSGAKGLWIENGQVARPVRNVTIASNILDMLSGIDLVGDDLYLKHSTGTPTFRIADMKVGGA
jgi:PmbA protein